LNLKFLVAEFFLGLLSDSLALLAGDGHTLSDVVCLLLALEASYLARSPATPHLWLTQEGRDGLFIEFVDSSRGHRCPWLGNLAVTLCTIIGDKPDHHYNGWS
jgi:hypothetical protein